MTPSATATTTPSATPTETATTLLTETATAVPTDTATPTPTPTVLTAVISYPFGLNLRTAPSRTADVLLLLDANTIVILLDGRVEADGLLWQQVEVSGFIGWVSDEFLQSGP
ncbi:MAG: SH3 domain-containing protein [Chloroflexota bacterium]